MYASDVHFILGHIHQGVIEKTEWDVEELYKELQRLRQHIGWPNQKFLSCPILTQDKLEYLKCHDNTNPTLRVSMPKVTKVIDKSTRKEEFSYSLTSIEILSISSWCTANTEGFGWVVKAPYTTNKGCRHFCNSTDAVINSLKNIAKRFGPIQRKVVSTNKVLGDSYDRPVQIIPYIMIQPCMKNRLEYKVVVLNGKAISETWNGNSSHQHSRAFGTSESRLKWAEEQVRTLRMKCPHALLDGLVRVDFFCDMNGKWVVNEFESLEAGFSGPNPTTDIEVMMFLKHYWLQKLLDIFRKD